MLRLTRKQVREVDRLAVEKYHVPSIVLMENAARAVAAAAIELMGGRKDVGATIVCGGGNNGGDGLAAARHLHNYGWHIDLVNAATKPYQGDAATNYAIARAMNLETESMYDADVVVNPHAADLVIDAVFGTGLSAEVKDDYRHLIETMNESRLPILSVDLPSGMDCDTGQPLGICVRATKTVTFVAEKAGFANPKAREFTGDVVVGDIGCPRELIEEVSRPQ